MQEVAVFIFKHVAKQLKAKQDGVDLIYSSKIRKTWNIWISYQEMVYNYHRND